MCNKHRKIMYPAVTKSKNLVWNPLSRKKEKKKEKQKKGEKRKTVSSTSETQTRAHNTFFSRERRDMRSTGQNNIGRNLSSRKTENKRKPKNKSENLELIRSYCDPSHSKHKHTQT